MPRSLDSAILTRFKEAASRVGKPATQAGVAEMMGIQQPSVAEWNRGGLPTMAKTVQAALDSGLCVEWLYTGRGPKFPPPDDEGDHQLREFIEVWRKLAPDVKTTILQTAKFLRTVQSTADPSRVKEVHRDLEKANHRFRLEKEYRRR